MGYTDIYLDFIDGNGKAGDFYRARNLESVAAALDGLSFPREKMATILHRQNKSFGAGEATLKNIDALTDPRAVALFSGQQAVLFGGPLLVVVKALSIIKAARLYSEQLQRPVLPIFWVAGDDHDFEEVNRASVLNREGDIQTVVYGTPPDKELPTSQIRFADRGELRRAINELKEVLGETDFTAELYDGIEKAYSADDTFVSGFGKLMIRLLGRHGLVLFNPGDKEAKTVAAPLFKRIVQSQDAVHNTLTETNERIQSSGYHIQVEKADDSTHLFYNDGGRKPIHREGKKFTCDGKSFSKEELLSLIDSHPERFSPDVITRPVLQSYLFPVVSQKGGPSEIAYLAQINPVFELFDVVPPVHKARPSATLVEGRMQKLMEEYKIDFQELTGDIEQVINRVMSESFPDDIEQEFSQLRQDVELRFEQFAEKSLKFDPGLENFAKQTFGKVDYALRNFEGKVFASHKKKSDTTRQRIYRLGNALYPDRSLQERKLNVSYFLARYGTGVLDFALEQIESEETAHQLLFLSEMTA